MSRSVTAIAGELDVTAFADAEIRKCAVCGQLRLHLGIDVDDRCDGCSSILYIHVSVTCAGELERVTESAIHYAHVDVDENAQGASPLILPGPGTPLADDEQTSCRPT